MNEELWGWIANGGYLVVVILLKVAWSLLAPRKEEKLDE